MNTYGYTVGLQPVESHASGRRWAVYRCGVLVEGGFFSRDGAVSAWSDYVASAEIDAANQRRAAAKGAN